MVANSKNEVIRNLTTLSTTYNEYEMLFLVVILTFEYM